MYNGKGYMLLSIIFLAHRVISMLFESYTLLGQCGGKFSVNAVCLLGQGCSKQRMKGCPLVRGSQ